MQFIGSVTNHPEATKLPSEGKLLDGLLAAGFDEGSCLSRYQSFLHYKTSPHKPALISFLSSEITKLFTKNVDLIPNPTTKPCSNLSTTTVLVPRIVNMLFGWLSVDWGTRFYP